MKTYLSSLSMLFAAHVAMAATTVQMTPVADATLYENVAGLYANSQGAGVFAGLNGGGAIRRALVRFDLSSLPADVTVTNVSLKLVVTRSLSGFSDLSFHRITHILSYCMLDSIYEFCS